MSQLVLQEITESGAAITTAAADDGGGSDLLPNVKGDTIVFLDNLAGVGASTITITPAVTSINHPAYGVMAKEPVIISVPAGETRTAGPFAKSAFNNSSNNVTLTYSGDETALLVGSYRNS